MLCRLFFLFSLLNLPELCQFVMINFNKTCLARMETIATLREQNNIVQILVQLDYTCYPKIALVFTEDVT